MKKEEKEKKIKNRFNYRVFIIIILSISVLVGTNIFPLVEKDEKVEVKKATVKSITKNKIQKVEVSPVLDTTSNIDTLSSNTESEISEPVISVEMDALEENSSSSKKKKRTMKIILKIGV